MAGAWIGATLAHWLPGVAQLAMFAGVMLLAAWRMLQGATVAASGHEPRASAVVGGGFGVGLLSGLVEVGGGFLVLMGMFIATDVARRLLG